MCEVSLSVFWFTSFGKFKCDLLRVKRPYFFSPYHSSLVFRWLIFLEFAKMGWVLVKNDIVYRSGKWKTAYTVCVWKVFYKQYIHEDTTQKCVETIDFPAERCGVEELSGKWDREQETGSDSRDAMHTLYSHTINQNEFMKNKNTKAANDQLILSYFLM